VFIFTQLLPLQQASSAQPSKHLHPPAHSTEAQLLQEANSTSIHAQQHYRHLHASTADDAHLISGDALTRQEKARIWALCGQSQGTWCRRFHRQQALPFKKAPRGSKTCPKDCNGVGNCNADTGICECPAGGRISDHIVQRAHCVGPCIRELLQIVDCAAHVQGTREWTAQSRRNDLAPTGIRKQPTSRPPATLTPMAGTATGWWLGGQQADVQVSRAATSVDVGHVLSVPGDQALLATAGLLATAAASAGCLLRST
jgi:hypothetical protein